MTTKIDGLGAMLNCKLDIFDRLDPLDDKGQVGDTLSSTVSPEWPAKEKNTNLDPLEITPL